MKNALVTTIHPYNDLTSSGGFPVSAHILPLVTLSIAAAAATRTEINIGPHTPFGGVQNDAVVTDKLARCSLFSARY